MKKEITHEEKLEFYKTFTSAEFQNKYKNIESPYNIDTFIRNLILFCSSIALSFINPILLLVIVYPIVIAVDHILTIKSKQQSLIESINKNISYKDFKKLKHSYEWTLLGYELSAINMNHTHYAENSELIVEDKSVNNPRSLNVCIINEDTNQNSQNETNLVKKTEKRHKKQKIENKPRSLNCCIIKNEEIKLTYSMLSDFAESVGCSLVEFAPSLDYEESKTYIVKLKNNKKIISFEVSGNHFIGLYQYSDTDLTAEWREFIAKTNNNSANV